MARQTKRFRKTFVQVNKSIENIAYGLIEINKMGPINKEAASWHTVKGMIRNWPEKEQ